MRRIAMTLVIGFMVAGCGSVATIQPATQQPAGATVEPSEEPLPSDTPEVTPEESGPFAMLGAIEFGADFDADTLAIKKPATSFKTTTKAIAWVAHLTGAAGGTTLAFSLTKRSSGGAEKTIVSFAVDVANPEFDTLANKMDLGLLVDRQAGTYVMRYIREGEVLAEGTFKLVK